MKLSDLAKKNPFFIRLLNFEYWPSYVFYLPMMAYFFILVLRSRHICFFTAANPGIKMGGNGVESKYQTILKIPEKYRPKTIFVASGTSFEETLVALKEAGIQFPLIAKPDIGFRGLLVKKFSDTDSLKHYLEKYPIDFIIQEYVNYPNEFGVLYYRLPGENKGQITSITLKEFLHVIGDGSSSVETLVAQKPRAILQLDRLQDTHADWLNYIPKKGEKVNLGEIGNHSKGTFFKDGNDHIDDQIRATFDEISSNIEGVFYGRYDIRSTSLEDLKAGRNLKIIEINGVFSEPTHIYDPFESSYFKALKEIKKHWSIIYKVSIANHNQGIPYMKFSSAVEELKSLNRYSKKLNSLTS